MNVVLRNLFLILLFSAGQMALYSQSAEEDVIRLKADQEVEAVESGNVETKKGLENGSWNLLVGTGFSYMKGYGSGMGFYAAPTYTLGANISIGASVTMTNGQGYYRGSPLGNSSTFGSPFSAPLTPVREAKY